MPFACSTAFHCRKRPAGEATAPSLSGCQSVQPRTGCSTLPVRVSRFVVRPSRARPRRGQSGPARRHRARRSRIRASRAAPSGTSLPVLPVPMRTLSSSLFAPTTARLRPCCASRWRDVGVAAVVGNAEDAAAIAGERQQAVRAARPARRQSRPCRTRACAAPGLRQRVDLAAFGHRGAGVGRLQRSRLDDGDA